METQLLLANAFLRNHPEDAARLLERVQPGDAGEILSQATAEHAARVLERMIPVHATAALRPIPSAHAVSILKELSVDYASSLIRRFPEERQEEIIAALDGESGERIARVLRYPPETAGALMDPSSLVVPHDVSIEDAQNRVHEVPEYVRYYIYVVDRNQQLVGVVSMRQLMSAAPSSTVLSIMDKVVATIRATAAREEIIANPYWKEYHALPVVDAKGMFLGVLRYETLRRLEESVNHSRIHHAAMDTATAMGELFWIGLSGMLGGVISGVAPQAEPPQPPKRGKSK